MATSAHRPGSAVAIILVLSLGMASAAGAGPIDDLRPGEWYEVPNSHLRAVAPSPEPPGYSGVQSVIGAWSGGAFDTLRDRLIIWGGGHGDYGGNEIYAFDLNSLSWSRIWGPSPDIPGPGGGCVDTYSDGNPVSRHTYDGLEYLPAQDRFWINGGSRYCGSGGAGRDTWVFDFATSRWIRKVNLPICEGCAYLEQVTGYDPVTGHIFLAQPELPPHEYDPVADTWTERGDRGIGYSKSGVFDPVHRLFVIAGEGEVMVFDLSGSGRASRQYWTTTGATEILSGRYPGLEFDPVSGKIVAWNGGPNVYTLDVTTRVWTKHTTTGSVIPTSAPSAGTYGRWRYVPSKNIFVCVNHIDENVYVYRLSAGGGAPADSIAPSAPQDLRPR